MAPSATKSVPIEGIETERERQRKRKRKRRSLDVVNDEEEESEVEPDTKPHDDMEPDLMPLEEIEGIDNVEDVAAFKVGNDECLSRLALDSQKRAQAKSAKNSTTGGFEVRPNYRYRLDDGRIGQCRYIGYPLFAKTSEKWIGMVIEFNGEGEHNGSVQNRSYFRCRDGKGVFVRPYRLIEDLGINTIQLTQRQIEGDDQTQRQIERSNSKRKEREKKKRKKARSQRAHSMSSNLDANGKWVPPEWTHDVEQDHGYNFLEQKPLSRYSKEKSKKGRRKHARNNTEW